MQAKRTTYNPWHHVEELNLHVVWGGTNGNLGLWDGHKIHLDETLTAREQTSVLSHEIVHAEFEDEPTLDHVWHARREARCDRIAAERLINPTHLLELATITDDIGIWAIELGVTGWLLEAYLKAHPDGLRI